MKTIVLKLDDTSFVPLERGVARVEKPEAWQFHINHKVLDL
jgi:hypothetical protein